MALAQQRAARAATAKNAATRPCIRLVMGPVRCPRNAMAAAPLSRKHLRGQARPIFPFTAVIGQEEMKLALILNVIDPKIGGVMIMGDRGTGKTTTIRALADLLPQVPVVAKDPFNSDPYDAELMSEEVRQRLKAGEELPVGSMKIPMVDLPLGATEDRVCGTIDIEKALTEGVKAFEPGLLAKANRGILYVDEREGISISHPARFILVGSGNPEEGELRPQLLDRFGMHAQIGTVRDPELRVQIVSERSTFDENPAEFHKKCAEKQQALTQRIVEARTRLKTIAIPYDFRVKISAICSELNVDGIRGDIVSNRAAKALASFEGRDEVAVEDIYRVIPLCLRHRLRTDPMADIDNGDRVRQVFKQIFAME
ncbi:magnesium chelatase subunit of protochlorophyllide reductase [Scenedesmus sp. NREL 46B-D3]|nr:magnesium chelatase subunit of protochlorophyllide reductase [Scenedesmus sp. NREL 46B-D3]